MDAHPRRGRMLSRAYNMDVQGRLSVRACCRGAAAAHCFLHAWLPSKSATACTSPAWCIFLAFADKQMNLAGANK
jgi:hypothetical protein